MAYEQITAEVSERILTITLNRPERLNAWTPTMYRELIEALDRADEDDEVRESSSPERGMRIAPEPTSQPEARLSTLATWRLPLTSIATMEANSRCGCSHA